MSGFTVTAVQPCCKLFNGLCNQTKLFSLYTLAEHDRKNLFLTFEFDLYNKTTWKYYLNNIFGNLLPLNYILSRSVAKF